MFQTFDSSPGSTIEPARIGPLRDTFHSLGVDAVLVPRSDEHQGEYVPANAERLRWLTGFTGSAGSAAVTRDAAALFVDGRYTVQARGQVDTGAFDILQVPTAKLSDWLASKLPANATVGFDPWLHTVGEIERLTTALAAAQLRLKPLAANPIDRLWGRQRPAAPLGLVKPHPTAFAGVPTAVKVTELQKQLSNDGQDAVVLTLPDSIAWLFNIRGSDVPHTPVVLAFAIVPAQGQPELFLRPEKIDAEAHAYLAPLATLLRPSDLPARLTALKDAGRRVRLDPETAAWWIYRRLGAKSVVRAGDPCLLPKARKNEVEIAGTRAAHQRDGGAVTRFLAWLDREVRSGTVDEITTVRRLEEFRSQTQALKEISFDTISGSGPHGAIVHYRVTAASNRHLQDGELFLLDSGGQYLDGTTDITRTIAIGEPSEEMRERFTLVLKGHIAVATARFPKGTRGIDIDPFARRPLWERGLDYDHGTGHGVGSYLSVHEGPASLSRRGMAPLEPGMIVSNEPGYYKEGAYGIRIENLLLVTTASMPEGGDRETMGFETLTLAPIDRRLIIPTMLEPAERQWLNAYHARVRDVIGGELTGEDRQWLDEATAEI